VAIDLEEIDPAELPAEVEVAATTMAESAVGLHAGA
jgi:hypothetical protein